MRPTPRPTPSAIAMAVILPAIASFFHSGQGLLVVLEDFSTSVIVCCDGSLCSELGRFFQPVFDY